MPSAPRPKSQAAKTPAPKTPARSKTPTRAREPSTTRAREPSAAKAKAKAKSKAVSETRKSPTRKANNTVKGIAKSEKGIIEDPAPVLRTSSEKVLPTTMKVDRGPTSATQNKGSGSLRKSGLVGAASATAVSLLDVPAPKTQPERRALSQRSQSSVGSLPSEPPAEPAPELSPPAPLQPRTRTPELLRGTRQRPAEKTDNQKHKLGSRNDNQMVASWLAQESKIRTSMPLNSAAEQDEKPRALHPTAEARMAKGRKRRGVKMYTNVPTQASAVDQVVFGRDMDFSNGEGGYGPFQLDKIGYDGRAGIFSQQNGKAGGLKKVAGAPQEQWSIAADEELDNASLLGTTQPPNQAQPGMRELSHLNSVGVSGALGGEGASIDELHAARAAFYTPGTGLNDSAGAPSWKEQKSVARKAVHDGQGVNQAGVDEVGQVMIHNEGPPISVEKEVRGRRYLDSAKGAIEPDMAGHGDAPEDEKGTKFLVTGVAGCLFRESGNLGLNVADRGKRILRGYQDVGGEGKVAGSLTAHIETNGMGFLASDWRRARLKDHGPRASQVLRGRSSVMPQTVVPRASLCITDKLIYQQLTPRMERLVPTHQHEILGGKEKPHGKKHLAHMNLPATQQNAVIYERPHSARQATPRSEAQCEGSSGPSRARSSVFDTYEPFVGAAGHPSEKRDRDAGPRRARTPPPSYSRPAWLEDAPVTPRHAVAGVPTERGPERQSPFLGGKRMMKGSASQGSLTSRHMHAGSSVAALLAWDP